MLLGAVIGNRAAIGVNRLMASMLYDVHPVDVATFARSPSWCLWSRSRPATFPRGAPCLSIPWWRCGVSSSIMWIASSPCKPAGRSGLILMSVANETRGPSETRRALYFLQSCSRPMANDSVCLASFGELTRAALNDVLVQPVRDLRSVLNRFQHMSRSDFSKFQGHLGLRRSW